MITINDYRSPEINTISGKRQGKRRLASKNGCMHDLNNELQQLFDTFYQALENSQRVLNGIPVRIRSKTLEPSLMQTFFAGSLFDHFQNKALYGKYKRLILSVNGYIVLFKKLNNKGVPMNIKTKNVQMINNQSLSLDLFSDSDGVESPILYFGYQKDRFGVCKNPQLIYIDEERVKFSITEQEISYQVPMFTDHEEFSVKPELKAGLKSKINKAI
ncbi:hypothetical protein [Dyadobacter bucti]|uniref:hypothetical protein n=1 Tax=Dyadobacter bucti TaxID=2572203 RepID=UPI001109B8DF|nr:hypothetical protein [Dyadobacter bucti]